MRGVLLIIFANSPRLLALLVCGVACSEPISLRNAPLVEGGSASATHVPLPDGDALGIEPSLRDPGLDEQIWHSDCGGNGASSSARFVLPVSAQPPIYVLAIDAAAVAVPAVETLERVELVLDLPQAAVVWLVSATETHWELALRPGSVLPVFEVLSPSVGTEVRLVGAEPALAETRPPRLRYHLWQHFVEGYPFVVTPFGLWRADAELCAHATFFDRFDVLPEALQAGARRLDDLRAARNESERAAAVIDRCGLAGLRELIEGFHSASIAALDTCLSPVRGTLAP